MKININQQKSTNFAVIQSLSQFFVYYIQNLTEFLTKNQHNRKIVNKYVEVKKNLKNIKYIYLTCQHRCSSATPCPWCVSGIMFLRTFNQNSDNAISLLCYFCDCKTGTVNTKSNIRAVKQKAKKNARCAHTLFIFNQPSDKTQRRTHQCRIRKSDAIGAFLQRPGRNVKDLTHV